MKKIFESARLALIAAPLGLLVSTLPALAQSIGRPSTPTATAASSSTGWSSSASLPDAAIYYGPADTELALPSAPEPFGEGGGGGKERAHMAEDAQYRQQPFSRIGIGADVNPLGIGIKGAVVLNHYYDARVNVNFFGYSTGRIEVEGFNVNADLHMASMGASLDWYPLGSIWRISPGLMLYNGNQVTGSTDIVPGTSFTIDNQNYYSASPNAATGATPLSASGVVSLHKNEPAFTIAGGFGKFIPRSDRHWSFPSEFGVVFNGAPSIKVNATGWACTDVRQTHCSDIGDPANPIAIQFNNALNAQLAKFNKTMGNFTLYPLFSYSVVYSFDIRK